MTPRLFYLPLVLLIATITSGYADDLASMQMLEGIQILTGGETAVHEYFLKNGTWPPNIYPIYPAGAKFPPGNYAGFMGAYTSPDGKSYALVVMMKHNGVDAAIAGKWVEVWSGDGGGSWHCGPAKQDPVAMQYLPPSCRSPDAP